MTSGAPATHTVDLALGTVQFGVAYGVAGRGEPVPEAEVRAILDRAAHAGIRVLDTAPAYGHIEARLTSLIGGLDFDVVSKVGPVPPGLDRDDAVRFVQQSVTRSMQRLGSRLGALLFHREEDLLGPLGDAQWEAAADASGGRHRLGASCYSPAALVELRRRYPIAVAQLPGNAFDQRLARPALRAPLQDVEVHLRSVFLQGLLLMPLDAAVQRVPPAAAALAAWDAWCRQRSVRPLAAALAIARNLPGARYCVVGVDRLDQLDEIVSAWDTGVTWSAPSLACESLGVIDPRCWGGA